MSTTDGGGHGEQPTKPIMLCETTGKCTCGAPADTPRGMHYAGCAIRRPASNPSTDPWVVSVNVPKEIVSDLETPRTPPESTARR